jgi:hypothetical protein
MGRFETQRRPPLSVRYCCLYCQQIFQPSKYRPQQSVCGAADCQRRRCAEYHRQKLSADPDYAQVVRDSQRKWRDAHPSYPQQYRDRHPEAVEQNRQKQRQRDRKRRVQNLVKNNAVLDLKQGAAEVWLVGPAALDLDKNNLVSSQLLIFQSVPGRLTATTGS